MKEANFGTDKFNEITEKYFYEYFTVWCFLKYIE